MRSHTCKIGLPLCVVSTPAFREREREREEEQAENFLCSCLNYFVQQVQYLSVLRQERVGQPKGPTLGSVTVGPGNDI